jgi:anti-sigma factor RsiW
MKTSSYPEITDELLSAYIDNVVSDAERALIEQAVHEDTTVAWRLATLRETVNLLRTMPVLQAPRSFTLTVEQLSQPTHTPALVPGVIVADQRTATHVQPTKSAQKPGRWPALLERWRGFWQTGSPVWRNAMAASMALLLVMVVVPAFLSNRGQVDQLAAPVAIVRDGAPAAESIVASESESPATINEQDAPSASKITAAEESVPLAPTAIGETPASAEAAGAATLQEESAGQPAPPVAQTVNDESVSPAMEAVQPPVMAGARSVAPSPRTEDLLNPLPPVEESAAAPYGVAGAEIAGASAAPVAPAPQQDLGGEAPAIIALEESATQIMVAPTQNDELSVTAAAPADADGVVPEPVATSDAVAIQPAAVQEQETVDAPATLPEGEAELRRDSAAPPARDVASVGPAQLLPWLQLALLGAVIVFGVLWQRSRRNA